MAQRLSVSDFDQSLIKTVRSGAMTPAEAVMRYCEYLNRMLARNEISIAGARAVLAGFRERSFAAAVGYI